MGFWKGTLIPSASLPQTEKQPRKGPKMFSLQKTRCLLLVVAFGAEADAYGRRRKQNANVDKVDVRQSRGSSVEDFDISDRRSPSTEDFGVEVFDVTDFDASDRSSVEDFDGQDRSEKIQNFQTPSRSPFGEITQRRPLGSWSSWTFSQKPNFKFPTRNRVKTEERPRKPKKMPASDPVNFPSEETYPKKTSEPPVKRVVIFPCQKQNLRCLHIPTDVESPYHCRWVENY